MCVSCASSRNRALRPQLSPPGCVGQSRPFVAARRRNFQTLRDTRAVIDQLRAAGVYVDCRGSTLRLSPADLTTDAGVDQLFALLKRLL
jgi:hypothetical protein